MATADAIQKATGSSFSSGCGSGRVRWVDEFEDGATEGDEVEEVQQLTPSSSPDPRQPTNPQPPPFPRAHRVHRLASCQAADFGSRVGVILRPRSVSSPSLDLPASASIVPELLMDILSMRQPHGGPEDEYGCMGDVALAPSRSFTTATRPRPGSQARAEWGAGVLRRSSNMSLLFAGDTADVNATDGYDAGHHSPEPYGLHPSTQPSQRAAAYSGQSSASQGATNIRCSSPLSPTAPHLTQRHALLKATTAGPLHRPHSVQDRAPSGPREMGLLWQPPPLPPSPSRCAPAAASAATAAETQQQLVPPAAGGPVPPAYPAPLSAPPRTSSSGASASSSSGRCCSGDISAGHGVGAATGPLLYSTGACASAGGGCSRRYRRASSGPLGADVLAQGDPSGRSCASVLSMYSEPQLPGSSGGSLNPVTAGGTPSRRAPRRASTLAVLSHIAPGTQAPLTPDNVLVLPPIAPNRAGGRAEREEEIGTGEEGEGEEWGAGARLRWVASALARRCSATLRERLLL